MDINCLGKLCSLYDMHKRYRIPKGQSKMNNTEKLATQGTQDEEKQNYGIVI